jgi:hypothetical protein
MAFALTFAGQNLFAEEPASIELDGIFQGNIAYLQPNGTVRDVDLQVSLTMTGETSLRPGGGSEQVIDGAFLLDGEGGAYTFNKVSFDLDEAKLDMKYNRQEINGGSEEPASFRLVGYFNAEGLVEGRVFSGDRGPIGKFTLKRTDRTSFDFRANYAGDWSGFAKLRDGGKVPVSISLVDREGSTTNPIEMEFSYTPGKLAHIRWASINFAASTVTIDYLRGVVNLRRTESGTASDIVIEFKIDPVSRFAIGIIKSSSRGLVASFELPPKGSVQ